MIKKLSFRKPKIRYFSGPMKAWHCKILLSFFLLTSLSSREPEREKSEYAYQPIYAGTLLAFFGNNIPPGDCLCEPYLFVGNVNGIYDHHWQNDHQFNNFESQLLLLIETGITQWLDIALTINENYASTQGGTFWGYGDTRLALGFQVTTNRPKSLQPDFRIILLQSFPSGKYDHLDPRKHFGDAVGSGAYETWAIAIVRKIIYFTPRQPIAVNFNLGGNISTNANVKGISIYGGDNTTRGSVHPGQQVLANLGLEYSLTVNWIFGLDLHYRHHNKSRSKHCILKVPSSEEYSLAPCIEYNPNTHFGLEAGAWFSVAGRNNLSFASGVFTAYWLF
jgi:hypothetical protein